MKKDTNKGLCTCGANWHTHTNCPSGPCSKSKDGEHKDDGGMFWARCRYCRIDLELPYVGW